MLRFPLGVFYNKFNLKDETYACMTQIVKESLATFRTNEDELLEALPSPAIGGQQMIILLLECLLIHLLRRLSSKENANIIFLDDSHFYTNLVETILAYLKENIDKKLSLDELCVKFNYSKSFLCKIVKTQTGNTIINLFNEMKVAEAKKLLIKDEKSITAIAYALGFQEVKYFGYIFKKHTGVSPATFRKKNGGKKL